MPCKAMARKQVTFSCHGVPGPHSHSMIYKNFKLILEIRPRPWSTTVEMRYIRTIYSTNSIPKNKENREKEWNPRTQKTKNWSQNIQHAPKGLKERCSNKKTQKNRLWVVVQEFNSCHRRNHDVVHEINSGDDDGNPTPVDTSWGWSRQSREG